MKIRSQIVLDVVHGAICRRPRVTTSQLQHELADVVSRGELDAAIGLLILSGDVTAEKGCGPRGGRGYLPAKPPPDAPQEGPNPNPSVWDRLDEE